MIVFFATGHPEQAKLTLGLLVHIGELLVEIDFLETARTERSDPREMIEPVEPEEQRLFPTHRETGNGARRTIRRDAVILFHVRDDLGKQRVMKFREAVVMNFRPGRPLMLHPPPAIQ